MKKVSSIIMTIVIIMMAIMPAAAASDSFVPSIDAKDGPKIIMQTDSKGNEVAAIIYDKDGHEIIGVPDGAVIVTPVSDLNGAADAIKEALTYANKQINDSGNLGDLTDELAAYLKQHYPEMNLNDLVVSQLFDIRLDDEYSKYLADGAYFRVMLDVGESFILYLMSQNQVWSLGKDYKVDGDIVTLDLTGPTQIALVKSNYTGAVPADKNEAQTTSPQTGNYTNVLLITLGVLFAAGAALLIVMLVRSKSKAAK